MATSVASDKPVVASLVGDGFDPFVMNPSGPTHLRHSNFDGHLLALAPGASAEQTKRAIEAHLRDTERRMEEAGKLGTALVQQQKELTEKLREVERLQSEAELDPELRQRLLEIEKDYNEVARDSARALLPKQRVPSSESQGSPYAMEGMGRRSASPSKFETLATPSPTKFSVPNRKVRNQPVSRIHDIEFAAEISTSLISQVRNLQTVLSEREEELKEVKAEKIKLELEAEGFQQHLKNLDESESRYKDENWNLETQIHELIATQKEGADREKKLAQSLAALQAEKNATQRELEELKENMTKQEEKHSAAIRNLEIELGTSRRNAVVFEAERTSLQKKVEELTSQNQELAKAFSAQRGRMLERESTMRMSGEDSNSASDHNTPEHSPPPSPVKMTPRHSALESETLKTSLGHAQRTIQTLRTNIHREKTEKLELKRMLQDARDEIEKMRNEPDRPTKKNRKVESREFKKPNFKVTQLGGVRPSRIEVVEDPDWEDQSEAPSPRISPQFASPSASTSTLRLGRITPIAQMNGNHYDTSTDASDAFETAHEGQTETEQDIGHETGLDTETDNFLTEDFQTGMEEMSDDTATETESRLPTGAESIRRPPLLAAGRDAYSFDSTASTSSDEDDYRYNPDMKSPSAHQANRMRMRMSRQAPHRGSRQYSEEPRTVESSPISFASPRNGVMATPQQQLQQQSLFAELGELDNSDEDSYIGAVTPSRRSIRSTPVTPGSLIRGHLSPAPNVPRLPTRVTMVDSGTMTDPVDIRDSVEAPETAPEFDDYSEARSSPQSAIFLARSKSMESVIGPLGPPVIQAKRSVQWLGEDLRKARSVRSVSGASYSDASVQHAADAPSAPASPARSAVISGPTITPVPVLSLSVIHSEDIEPQTSPRDPLTISGILSLQTEPVSEPLPELTLSSVRSEHVEPLAPVAPALSLPTIVSQAIEPIAEPEPAPIPLSFSTIHAEEVEPVSDPEPEPAPLTLSAVQAVHDVEPIEAPKPEPLVFSSIYALHDVEPIEVPEPEPIPLSFSAISSEQVEPIAEPEQIPAALSFSTVHALHDFEPVAELEPEPIALSFSTIQAQQVEPVVEPQPAPKSPVVLSFSTLVAEEVEPVEAAEPLALPLPLPIPVPVGQRSLDEKLEPQSTAPVSPPLSFSSIVSEHVEPFVEAPVSPVTLSISPIKAEEVEPFQEPEVPAPVLAVASILSEVIEPSEAVQPALSLASIATWDVEPREEIQPEFSLSTIKTWDIEPREVPAPALSLSTIESQIVEPIEMPEAPAPPLSLSTIRSQVVEPIEMPEPPAPPLSLSTIHSQVVEPIEMPEPPAPPLSLSTIHSQVVEPIEAPTAPIPALSISPIETWGIEPKEVPEVPQPALSLSTIESQAVEPVEAAALPVPTFSISSIESQAVEPVAPEEPKAVPAPLTISAIQALHTEPRESSRSPKRDAFIIPRDPDVGEPDAEPSEEPTSRTAVSTADQGAQTTLTSEAIDQMLKPTAHASAIYDDHEASGALFGLATPSTVRVNRPREESFDTTARSKGKGTDVGTDTPSELLPLRRPGSSTSIRSALDDVPPLPSNHKEAIEAARSGSSQGGQGTINSMPPPLFPASALRPRTPTNVRRPLSPVQVPSGRGTPTPRASYKTGSVRGTSEVHSPSRLTSRSRKSSISSFASEVDTRFGMHPEGGYDAHGLGPNTDPRMIQAITQTMIGEYLWKYTRKAGRGEMSENRHRRYFWVHPYTRTLYWSDRDPSNAGRHELRAKSVPIEAVRVVADDNPMPPGLHRKSLVIISPGRTVKFTCTTGQRHETWFNALSYLLLRTSNGGQSDAEEIAGNITREDVDEFNPTYARESPTIDGFLNVPPTLTPSRSKGSNPPQARPGTLSRISGYWKESKVLGGTIGSLRSRSVSGRDTAQSFYESSEVQDSAEDLRQMIERQDRESDRLENVRACCDGKHDVGTLHGSTKRGRHSRAGMHSHTGPSSTPTPAGTIRSRP